MEHIPSMLARKLMAANVALPLMLSIAGSTACAGKVEHWQRYPLATAPRLNRPPTLDGKIGSTEWYGAALRLATGSSSPSSRRPTRRTGPLRSSHGSGC